MWKCSRRPKGKRLFQTIICWTVVSCVVFSVFLVSYSTDNLTFEDDNYQVIIDIKNNYFQSLDELKSGKFLVQNDKCNIPDLDVWSRSVQPFITNQKDRCNCNAATLNVTYVYNYAVAINEEVLEKAGFHLDDVECCYRVIKRVEQKLSSYDKNADNVYRYSQECHQMEKFTIPKGEYIKVKCNARGLVGRLRFSYQNFHFIPKLPLPEINGGSLARKLMYWKQCANPNRTNAENDCYKSADGYTKPPNVLLLGIDSTSRINFRRFLHKTIDFLTKNDAVEMTGYTKVGENTFPNFIPLMSSYSEEELTKICYSDRYKPQDKCPYLWKTFSELHYLTGHLEDAPKMAIFNYLKTGFVKSPVDFYLRPAMLAAYGDNGTDPYTVDCIGNQRPEEHVINFIMDLVSLAEESGIPYFITSWLTDLTHEDMNSVQKIDTILANGLRILHEKKFLENTVLLVMSDHGYRFLDVRATSSGWYEDKLPSLWIKLPPSITQIHPNWLTTLQYNSRQLTTPFDLHETLKNIAQLFPRKYKDEGAGAKSETGAISLFQQHPPRNCDEARIPSAFCACNPPIEYKSNLTTIKLAGEAILSHINSKNPLGCTPLKLASITGSGIFHKSDAVKNNVISKSVLDDSINLVIGLRTRPGDFHFEAWVTFNQASGNFSHISHVLRMNKITTSRRCLNDSEMNYETYCYCS